jgi:hypothetical protein
LAGYCGGNVQQSTMGNCEPLHAMNSTVPVGARSLWILSGCGFQTDV